MSQHVHRWATTGQYEREIIGGPHRVAETVVIRRCEHPGCTIVSFAVRAS